MKFVREHRLAFLIAIGGLLLIVLYVLWVAATDNAVPENPFIYDL